MTAPRLSDAVLAELAERARRDRPIGQTDLRALVDELRHTRAQLAAERLHRCLAEARLATYLTPPGGDPCPAP